MSTTRETITALGCVYCSTAPAPARFNSAPVCNGCIEKMFKGGWWQMPSSRWTAIELGLLATEGAR